MNIEQQREAFEAWYDEYLRKVITDSEGYQWPATRRAWDAWAAAIDHARRIEGEGK